MGFDVLEFACLNCGNDAAGGGNVEALAGAVTTAGPAGIHQIDAGAKFFNAFDEQVGVDPLYASVDPTSVEPTAAV